MLFTSVRANNNASEGLVHSWCLNSAVRETKLGRVREWNKSTLTIQKKTYQQNIGNPVYLKYTICSLSDETSN